MAGQSPVEGRRVSRRRHDPTRAEMPDSIRRLEPIAFHDRAVRIGETHKRRVRTRKERSEAADAGLMKAEIT
jgi:hypothetical protein